MASRFLLSPDENVFHVTSNFPQISKINGRPVLWFDSGTAESCAWTRVIPVGWTGTVTAIVHYIMASATSGKVDFEIQVEAVTPGDATDLDATTSFDTANTITAPTVPGTAGYESTFSCTLANMDGAAVGDYVRFQLKRDATDATNDTATGDCGVLMVEIQDGA